MDGSLSCSDFEQQARALSEASKRASCRQVWEWRPLPQGHVSSCSCSGWLSLSSWPVASRPFAQSAPEEEEGGGQAGLDHLEEELPADAGALPARDVRCDPPIFEYHVVHSATYSVPVLYLRGRSTGGGVLRPEEVWELCCSPEARGVGMGMDSSVPLPTPDEHPVTGEPFLFMHPCRTQESMALLGFTECGRRGGEAAEDVGFGYLLMWLSVYGGAVSLRPDASLRQ